MSMEITEELIDDAIRNLEDHDRCRECRSTKSFAVMGYVGLFCKCEAEKRAKTPQAKEIQMAVKSLMLVNTDSKNPKMGEFYGVPVIFSEKED